MNNISENNQKKGKEFMVLTDTIEETKLHSGLPGIPQIVTKAIKISDEELQKNLSSFTEGILDILSNIKTESSGFELDEIDFGLVFTGNGEIALLGAVKSSISAQTSAQLKFKRKKEDTLS